MPQGTHLFHGTEELLPHEPSQFMVDPRAALQVRAALRNALIAHWCRAGWTNSAYLVRVTVASVPVVLACIGVRPALAQPYWALGFYGLELEVFVSDI